MKKKKVVITNIISFQFGEELSKVKMPNGVIVPKVVMRKSMQIHNTIKLRTSTCSYHKGRHNVHLFRPGQRWAVNHNHLLEETENEELELPCYCPRWHVSHFAYRFRREINCLSHSVKKVVSQIMWYSSPWRAVNKQF